MHDTRQYKMGRVIRFFLGQNPSLVASHSKLFIRIGLILYQCNKFLKPFGVIKNIIPNFIKKSGDGLFTYNGT